MSDDEMNTIRSTKTNSVLTALFAEGGPLALHVIAKRCDLVTDDVGKILSRLISRGCVTRGPDKRYNLDRVGHRKYALIMGQTSMLDASNVMVKVALLRRIQESTTLFGGNPILEQIVQDYLRTFDDNLNLTAKQELKIGERRKLLDKSTGKVS